MIDDSVMHYIQLTPDLRGLLASQGHYLKGLDPILLEE